MGLILQDSTYLNDEIMSALPTPAINTLGNGELKGLRFPSRNMSEIDVWHNPDLSAIWCMARADAQTHCLPVMLEELILATKEVRGYMDSLEDRATVPLFWITGSNRPGVFRLGGDLRIFLDFIE